MTRDRISSLLSEMQGLKVGVVGDVMLDVYLNGGADRISPEAPVPVVKVESLRRAPGGAGNVALGLNALGVACTLVGIVGNDSEGEQLREILEQHGLSTDHLVTVPGRTTVTKTRVIAKNQHVLRYDRESDAEIGSDARSRLEELVEAALGDCDAVILQDYNKGVLSPEIIAEALRRSREHRIPSVADPKLRNFLCYDGTTVFKPNLKEFRSALGDPVVDGGLASQALDRARRRIGSEHLLVTLAEEGMVLLGPNGGEPEWIPAVAREVYDVSGAGDTVTTVLAAVLGAGGSVREGAILSTYAASVAVAKAGAAPVAPPEILEAFESSERAARFRSLSRSGVASGADRTCQGS